MHHIPLIRGKVYFVSDLHLGFPSHEESLQRERRFVRWLNNVADHADALFIVGDLFDFWFEYRQVVPRGFVRVLGKLAELSDAGVSLHLFAGNHDQWMFGYLEQELPARVYDQPQQFRIGHKTFYIAHGDGLGPGDHGYKLLRSVFRHKVARWLFARMHPNLGVWLGKRWSKNNSLLNGRQQASFLGPEKEWIVQHASSVLARTHFDYFIFGHRHLKLSYPLSDHSTLIYLGDWLQWYSYAVFDGSQLQLTALPTTTSAEF